MIDLNPDETARAERIPQRIAMFAVWVIIAYVIYACIQAI